MEAERCESPSLLSPSELDALRAELASAPPAPPRPTKESADTLPSLPPDRGDKGTKYWCADKGYAVVPSSNKTATHGLKLDRACARVGCMIATQTNDEEMCWRHGGKGVCANFAENGCTRAGQPKWCEPCRIRDGKLTPCPECGKRQWRNTHAQGWCSTCERNAKVVAKRAEGRAAQETMAAELGLDIAPTKAKDAKSGVRYVHIDQQSAYVPYCVVRIGQEYHQACAHLGCTKMRKHDGEKMTDFCVAHGGGLRCIGYVDRDTKEPKPCEYDVSITTSTNRYDGRCVKCFCYSFPNDERAIEAKKWLNAREQTARKVLEEALPDYRWFFDRGFGKSRLKGTPRPDARTHVGNRTVIVEVDEDSHRSYLCAAERAKEQAHVNALREGEEAALIRFNPDAYTDLHTGLFVPSPFKYNKTSGTVTVDPEHQKGWDERMAVLVWKVSVYLDPGHPDYMAELPPPQEGRPIYTEELFYDDVSGVTEADRLKMRARYRAMGKKRKRDAERAAAR